MYCNNLVEELNNKPTTAFKKTNLHVYNIKNIYAEYYALNKWIRMKNDQ